MHTLSLLSMLALPLSASSSPTSCAPCMATATKPQSSSAPPMALQQLQGSVSTSYRQGCCCKGFLASGSKPSHHWYASRGSCCSHMGRLQRCARCLAGQRDDITHRHGPLQGTSTTLLQLLPPINPSVCHSFHVSIHPFVPAGAEQTGDFLGMPGDLGDQSCIVRSISM